MDMKNEPRSALGFGGFVLDRGARRLTRGTEELHLSPKAFALLTILAERWPDAVSKDELTELLWPDTFVEASGLATLVADLRTALGDDAKQPQYIRTLHRFGYALVPSVQQEVRRTDYKIRARGRDFDLPPGESVIGRSAPATIVVDDASVSRTHARVTVSGDDVLIEDLGSKNGTFINGVRVEGQQPLRSGDVITAGNASLTLHRAGGTDSTVTVGHSRST